jgi:hypothetical protein
VSNIAKRWDNVVVASDDPTANGFAPIDRLFLLQLTENGVWIIEKLLRDELLVNQVQRNTWHEQLQKYEKWEFFKAFATRSARLRKYPIPNLLPGCSDI